jgi:hypothetical protein
MNFINSKKTGSLALILLSQTFIISTAQAASTDFFDHDTYTTDSISGLDWLDVTASTNRSYNDISSQFGTGKDFYGWRYATGVEFNALVTNYTGKNIAPNNTKHVYHQEDKIDGLVSLSGSTIDSHYIHYYGKTYDAFRGYEKGKGLDYTHGLIADSNYYNNKYLAILWDYDISTSDTDFSDSNYGSSKRILVPILMEVT